jgi:hypothetical protein
MTKLKLTWRKKRLAKEEDGSSGGSSDKDEQEMALARGSLTRNWVTSTRGRVTLTRVKRRIS